jgi:hypothetical protein
VKNKKLKMLKIFLSDVGHIGFHGTWKTVNLLAINYGYFFLQNFQFLLLRFLSLAFSFTLMYN